MSIRYTLLGLLSCGPSTGYDLKKILQQSPFMHWSGNNNQIYKALVELLEEGFVTYEVRHQESSPSKKIYAITEAGREQLKRWVLSPCEPPQLRSPFLLRLAWADPLRDEEWGELLAGYERELLSQQLMLQEQDRRGAFSPKRTPREARLWEAIYGRIETFYREELDWVRSLRLKLELSDEKERETMHYEVKTKGSRKYLECASAEHPLATEQDALDLLAACFEHDTRLILLHGEALTGEFLDLRSGLAGKVLQKFVNYRVKVAVVLTDESVVRGRVKEWFAESNKGSDFRVFRELGEAEQWLLG